jgi:hypothetical protein
MDKKCQGYKIKSEKNNFNRKVSNKLAAVGHLPDSNAMHYSFVHL